MIGWFLAVWIITAALVLVSAFAVVAVAIGAIELIDYAGLSLHAFWMFMAWAATLAMLAVTFFITLPPFDASYYVWHRVSGIETSHTQTQLVVDGDSGTEYVIRIKGDSRIFQVNDDRITQYDVGDRVSLVCRHTFHYHAAASWNCEVAS